MPPTVFLDRYTRSGSNREEGRHPRRYRYQAGCRKRAGIGTLWRWATHGSRLAAPSCAWRN